MEGVIEFVKPELLVAAVALYFVGETLKASKAVKDKFIPVILGVIGIALATIYVLATSDLSSVQNVLMAIFTAIVQGILVAGASTYTDQIIKQLIEKKE